jgi:hypothetical protein
MKSAALILIPVLLLAGCSTTVKYEAKTEAGAAKPPSHPIYIYPETMKVPRPHEVIGTIRVGDTPLTVMGGSMEAVLETLRKNARQRGADAVQLTYVEAPGFDSPHYRAEARLVRFTNAWESVAIPDAGLTDYFRTNAPALDPIEGVWAGNDAARSRIAILKNSAKPGREFIALLLANRNPTWQKGDKKLELARGERPGVYRGSFYLDDYQEKRVVVTLRGPPENRFLVHIPGQPAALSFTKP